MKRRRLFGMAVMTVALFVALFCFVESHQSPMLGFLNVASAGSSVTSTVTVGSSAPQITSIYINGNTSTITLTPNTTTNVNVEAVVSDNNGCSSITGGTTTILLYRSGVTSSSCYSLSGAAVASLNCYTATAFTASSTCSVASINTTTTFPVQYFAQATDVSSSFPSQNWMATVFFTAPGNSTGTGDSTNVSTTNDFGTLTAINVTTSSINYGSLQPGSTSSNQSTTIANAGNSSTTLQLSAFSTLASGANTITTSSQHYATSSSFSYGVSDFSLTGTPTSLSGFLLTAPTSSTNVQSSVFWALQVPNGTATGTYTGTNQFTSAFSN